MSVKRHCAYFGIFCSKFSVFFFWSWHLPLTGSAQTHRLVFTSW